MRDGFIPCSLSTADLGNACANARATSGAAGDVASAEFRIE
jgi:hypothetical protein